MSDESRIYDLFERAQALPPAERDAFIVRAAGDEATAERVRQLVRDDDDTPEGFLSVAPVSATEFDAPMVAATPEQIGPYRVVREIGRGGMGVVYEAEQENPRRRVALKVVRQGLAVLEQLARFKREVQALAQLHHPGIAHIYESGSARIGESDWPYFAMEHIEGLPLDRHAEVHHLDARARLELVARVCDAVQHAHQRGVIHRDLKPANVLVVREATGARTPHDTSGTVDSIGQPKVLDFGIARFTDADMQATMQTSTGQIIGTLAYMSPEQIEGNPEHLDTRVDVYALGVMLYTLVGGQPPHDLANLPVHEVARVIREDEPTLLSSIDTALRGDIATIAQKAMAKEKDRRYASAAELADDIRRHLRHEPISAAPPSTLYQLGKFARRNRTLMGGVVASFLLLLLGVVGTSVGLIWALRTNEALEHTNETLEQTNQDLGQLIAFQSAQIGSVDIQAMGVGLKSDLLEYVPEDQRSAVSAGLADVNFTDLARAQLNDNVLVRSITAADEQFADQPGLRTRLLDSLASTMQDLGLYENAEEQYRRVINVLESADGPTAESTLQAKSNHANLLIDMARYEEAEPILISTAEGLGNELGADHEETLSVRANLGRLYTIVNRNDEADPILQDVLERRTRALGRDHPETQTSIGLLALNLQRQGRGEEAAPLYDEVLEYRRSTLGHDHPSTIVTTANLGTLRSSLGQHEASLELATAAAESARRVHGEDHPSTLTLKNNLGATLVELDRHEEAEPYLREVSEQMSRLLGPAHANSIATRVNYASLLAQLDRPDEALAAIEPLVPIVQERDDDDTIRIYVLETLARLQAEQGRFEEAEAFLKPTTEQAIERLGTTHQLTQRLMTALRDLYIDWHELEPDAQHDESAARWQTALDGVSDEAQP
ncbi:MAG: serine/threonine-protein kinase [Planctomycetota bacterium]